MPELPIANGILIGSIGSGNLSGNLFGVGTLALALGNFLQGFVIY